MLPCGVFCDSISIHTPTKGVTDQQEYINSFADISIHTPTKGVTVNIYALYDSDIISIHTPTKGVTLPSDVFPENF